MLACTWRIRAVTVSERLVIDLSAAIVAFNLPSHEGPLRAIGASTGRIRHGLETRWSQGPRRGESPRAPATLGPPTLSPTSTESPRYRPTALRVLFTVRQPSSCPAHRHHPQARNLAALSSWAQGFQISIPLLLNSEEQAGPERARPGACPDHL